MKLSAKARYACLSMLDLAMNYDSPEPTAIKDTSERCNLPARFLVQILLQLKGVGLVESVRGASGGYRLAKRPEDITLGEIIQVTTERSCEDKRERDTNKISDIEKVINNAWDASERKKWDYLSERTLACLKSRVEMLQNSTEENEIQS